MERERVSAENERMKSNVNQFVFKNTQTKQLVVLHEIRNAVRLQEIFRQTIPHVNWERKKADEMARRTTLGDA